MCGIAGFLDFKNDISDEFDLAKDMSRQIFSRGPDEGGFFFSKNAVLIHRRLTVVDPLNGKQPMSFSDEIKDLTLVYNGELYNTEDLRAELILCGHYFTGHSDTEVLLHAFLEWDTACLTKLNGIYAFAVYDKNKNRLVLVRDRIGVKPLFYQKTPNGIIFASEIKALLRHPSVKAEIDEDGLNEIFSLAPARTFGNGIFRNVSEVISGHFIEITKDSFSDKTYWKLSAYENNETKKVAIEHTRSLVEDAIKRQLVSDVPLCTFLSGGLDSSIISAIASAEYQKTGKKLTTYSVDYTDNDKYFQKSVFQPNSDNEFIDIMTKYISSEHRYITLKNSSVYNALEPATFARDFAGMADIDSSLLLFCKEIKKEHTVGISGECADEFFGGYPWYHNEDILFEENFPWARSLDLRISLVNDGILKNPNEYVRERYNECVSSADFLPSDSKKEKRMREMFMLNLNWFMKVLLDRKDRMSMANGLEVRVPFCDHRVAEYAYNLPWELKSLNGREKGILRYAFDDLLPHEIVWRKKSPYPKTHNPIYFELVSKKVMKIMADKDDILSEILNKNTIKELIENPNSLSSPFFGQLMGTPQVLAFIIQLSYWFKSYKVKII